MIITHVFLHCIKVVLFWVFFRNSMNIMNYLILPTRNTINSKSYLIPLYQQEIQLIQSLTSFLSTTDHDIKDT
jgi:hypothetical protein